MGLRNGQLFFCLLVAVLLSGCSTVKARNFVEVRERVDQESEGGNRGYLTGTPPDEAATQDRTRKFYVFEFTKTLPEDELLADGDSKSSGAAAAPKSSASAVESFSSDEDEDDTTLASPPQEPVARSSRQSRRSAPSMEEDSSDDEPSDEKSVDADSGLPTTYKVQKNDTLQSISKKFYNSFSKWPKIYEVNKDKIHDPNRISPGITIKIPEI